MFKEEQKLTTEQKLAKKQKKAAKKRRKAAKKRRKAASKQLLAKQCVGEMKAILENMFEAIIKYAVERLADAHGLGLLVRGAEWALEGVKWLQVGAGDRRLVMTPAPMVLVELDLPAQVGRSSNDAEPLITTCFAPSRGPDPAVLVIDGYQISPRDVIDEDLADSDSEAATHARTHHTRKNYVRSVEVDGPVVMIQLDLSQLMSGEPEARVRAAALMCLTRDPQLLAMLRKRPLWDDLKAAVGFPS